MPHPAACLPAWVSVPAENCQTRFVAQRGASHTMCVLHICKTHPYIGMTARFTWAVGPACPPSPVVSSPHRQQ